MQESAAREGGAEAAVRADGGCIVGALRGGKAGGGKAAGSNPALRMGERRSRAQPAWRYVQSTLTVPPERAAS